MIIVMPRKSTTNTKNADTSPLTNENDAIRRINSKKNGGKDSVGNVPPEQMPPTGSRVVASDNVSNGTAGNAGSSASDESATRSTPVTPANISSTPVTPAITYNNDNTLTLTETQLRQFIDNGIRQASAENEIKAQETRRQMEELEKRLQDSADRAAEREAELVRKIEEERKQRDTIARVFSEFGYNPEGIGTANHNAGIGDRVPAGVAPQQAYIAPLSTRGGISPRDALREYQRICDDAVAMERKLITTATGAYKQRNPRCLDQFFKNNRQVLREAMQDMASKVGLLQGRSGYWNGKDAPTTFANFPVALQEYLSQVVRIEHSARFVLWQFCNKTIATGIPINQTVLVPRVRHLNIGTTSADWRLTPGTATVGTRQNLSGNAISVPILEWGMGKDATIEPLGIHELVNQVTILDIEQLVQQRIGYNYGMWEDLLLFEILLSTTVAVYNNGGSVVTAAADVAANGGGQVTMDFLGALRARMTNDKVPPLEDGCYIFVGTPDHFAPLESDMASKNQYADAANVEGLTNMLALKTRQEYMGRVQGYKGKVRGFHLFESTNISSGVAGTPGAQTETLGGVSVTTRSGFAMGADAVGMAEAMPMEIRESDDTDFGRMRSLIWKTHANMTGLDVDPSRTILSNEVARPVGGEEQLRVYEVRASTVKV